MQQAANPYRSPDATVADPNAAQAYGEVKPLSAAGRIGRVRYIAYSFVTGLIIYIPFVLLAMMLSPETLVSVMPFVMIIIGVLGLIAQFLFTIQRCHDFNVSGWLSLLIIVPLGVFVFWFVPGTQGPNRFGPPPPPNSKSVIVTAIAVPVILIILAMTAGAYMASTMAGMSKQDMEQLQEQLKQLEQQQQQEPQKDK